MGHAAAAACVVFVSDALQGRLRPLLCGVFEESRGLGSEGLWKAPYRTFWRREPCLVARSRSMYARQPCGWTQNTGRVDDPRCRRPEIGQGGMAAKDVHGIESARFRTRRRGRLFLVREGGK